MFLFFQRDDSVQYDHAVLRFVEITHAYEFLFPWSGDLHFTFWGSFIVLGLVALCSSLGVFLLFRGRFVFRFGGLPLGVSLPPPLCCVVFCILRCLAPRMLRNLGSSARNGPDPPPALGLDRAASLVSCWESSVARSEPKAGGSLRPLPRL